MKRLSCLFRSAALMALLLAIPVTAQYCELYISVQQRCHPGSPLANVLITASNETGQLSAVDTTNLQGSRRIVLPGNDEFSIQVVTDGYRPETRKIKNLCLKSAPHLIFYLFFADMESC